MKQQQVAPRDSGIDILRHIFAIAVIAQHMHSTSRYSPDTNKSLSQVVDWLDGAVLGFLLISGYLFKQPTNQRDHYIRQTKRLLIPFAFFSTIYAILLAISGKRSFTDGMLSTITLTGAGMQLYYLPYLLLATLLMPAINQKLKILGSICLPLLIVVLVIAALLVPTQASTGSDFRLIPLYLTSFALGNLFSQYRNRTHAIKLYIISIGSSLLLGIVDYRFFDLAAVTTLFAVTQLSGVKSKINAHDLSGAGGVYLLHTPIVNFTISTALIHLSITEKANIIISTIATYLLCLVAARAFVRLFPRHRWLLLE